MMPEWPDICVLQDALPEDEAAWLDAIRRGAAEDEEAQRWLQRLAPASVDGTPMCVCATPGSCGGNGPCGVTVHGAAQFAALQRQPSPNGRRPMEAPLTTEKG